VVLELVQELFDSILTGNRRVVAEREGRHAFQAKAAADLPAKERDRTIERARRVAASSLVAERRVVHASRLQVGADLHARERDKPDAGIVDIPAQQLRELGPELVGHAVWTGALGHLVT
jgi:hypothetical protein